MDKLFRFAHINQKRNFKLAINGFEDAKLLYSILLMDNDNFNHVLLFRNEITNEILMAGFDFTKNEIYEVCPKTALKVLELLFRKEQSVFREEDICLGNIQEIIVALKDTVFDKLFEHGSVLYNIQNFKFILGDSDEKKAVNIEVVFKENLRVQPEKLGFININTGLDYGELKFQSKEFSNLEAIHLLNDIKIRLRAESIDYEYDCLIFKSRPVNEESFVLTVSNILAELKNKGTKLLAGENSTLPSFMNAILDGTGIKIGKIEGYETTRLPYTVILPLENLKLENRELGYGNVTFYNSKDELNEINTIQTMLKDKFNLFMSDSYAKVHVLAENTFQAYQSAYRQVEMALNSIVHIVRSDNPLELYGIENKLIEWNRNQYIPNPRISSIFYVENSITEEKMVNDVTLLETPSTLILDNNFENRIENMEWYEDVIIAAMDNQLAEDKYPIINALKWLKRSWDAENIEDQVIYTNTAIEFLISKEKVESNIPKFIRRKMVKKSIEQFNESYINQELTKPEENDIRQKLSVALSSVPLMYKLRTMVNSLNVPIDDEDFKCIERIRNRRNEIMHGREKSEYLGRLDVWKANVIIGKIITYKIKQNSK